MKFLIDSKNVASGSSLHLQISGFSIEISDISTSGKIGIVEDSGKISIEVLPTVESLPIAVDNALLEYSQNEEDVKPLIEAVPEVEAVSEVQNIFPDLLFRKLVALRRQIAQEVKLPPYIIFHDTTLKDMVSKMPVDLEGMKEVSGVGLNKLEKYGSRFVDVIKEYLAESA